MQVRDIMTTPIEAVSANAYLTQAAKRMRSLDVGALPVQEGDSIVGIITGRDIVARAIAEDRDARITLVSEIMTKDISYCFQDASVEQAAGLMEDKHIHRLMVVDAENRPVGIVSLSDIAVKSCNEHLTWEVFERISEPAHPKRA